MRRPWVALRDLRAATPSPELRSDERISAAAATESERPGAQLNAIDRRALREARSEAVSVLALELALLGGLAAVDKANDWGIIDVPWWAWPLIASPALLLTVMLLVVLLAEVSPGRVRDASVALLGLRPPPMRSRRRPRRRTWRRAPGTALRSDAASGSPASIRHQRSSLLWHAECVRLTQAVNALETEIAQLVGQVAPQLLAEWVRATDAAKLVGEIAGAVRFSSDTKLARAAGLAPNPVRWMVTSPPAR